MAFYRVTIWSADGKVSQGIKELDNNNIDYATNYFKGLASVTGVDVVDIEAAMLSNKSTAVREFIENREKKRQNKSTAVGGIYKMASPGKDLEKGPGSWGESKKET
jgi:hypothetical protein